MARLRHLGSNPRPLNCFPPCVTSRILHRREFAAAMRKPDQHGTQAWKAIICLVAVLLLQAPYAQAAWMSSTACCMGDHCPIPSHHHKATTAESEMPMDCGHNMSKMAECKISCCKTTDESAINVAQFLLPEPQIVPALAAAIPPTASPAAQTISRSEKPQSPPPRDILS